MTKKTSKTTKKKSNPQFRVGAWLPSDQATLDAWLKATIAKAKKKDRPLLPVVQEFKDLIESDAEIYMLFHQMFDQVPHKPPYTKDPSGRSQIRDYHQMLQIINHVMTHAAPFDKTGLVGFPINAILDWPMGTPAGVTAFLNEKVNDQLKRILNEWAIFLGSSDSCATLNDHPRTGWFGKDALEAMPTMAEDFICDPELPHWGWTSWDDFFTRRFREGRRPLASPDDDNVIANACESAPYRLAQKVKRHDKFWIKSQPYSLEHMLAGDPWTPQFVGGTIYQAFLSAESYHRWHSPVSGTIVKAYVQDGTYYAETPAEGYDPYGPNESQGYITAVAARGIIFIEADNPKIGLMCFMAVGMAEVSTNEITVYQGQHVKKGEQLGMFHFGGSTHCLFFRPEVKLRWHLHGQKPGLDAVNIPLHAKIATVVK